MSGWSFLKATPSGGDRDGTAAALWHAVVAARAAETNNKPTPAPGAVSTTTAAGSVD